MKKKEQEKLAKEKAVQKKEKAKQAFYLCKTKCVCGKAICKTMQITGVLYLSQCDQVCLQEGELQN